MAFVVSLEQFARYIEALPGTYDAAWGNRSALGLYPMLGWLNTHPVVLQREALISDGAAFGALRMMRPHHNQVGTVVGWATKYLTGPGRPIRADLDSLPDLFDLAGRVWG